jgi:hypothetical protein
MVHDFSRIDGLPRASEATKSRYKTQLNLHLPDTDLNDFDAVADKVKTMKPATGLLLLVSALAATGDKRYHKLNVELQHEYKADLMDRRCKADPKPPTDWEKIKKNLMMMRHTGGQEAHAMYLLALIMEHHPRRLTDYHLLSDDETDAKKNNYIASEKKIKFNVFKNCKALLAGEREVELNPIVDAEIKFYCRAYPKRPGGFLFPFPIRRMRYLIKKYGIPSVTENRKEQETRDLRKGIDRKKTAMKFNHSVMTQSLHYAKLQPVE